MSRPKLKSVFIVDDDPDICEILQDLLESYGYRVATAANGADALDKLRAGEEPCLILLDLMMPVMDGIEFRDEQLRDPALAAIPVVIVSAGGDVAAKAAAAGVEGLTKPVDIDVLLATIRRFCCTEEAANR
jgi:CheY-like chemotaxis protein